MVAPRLFLLLVVSMVCATGTLGKVQIRLYLFKYKYLSNKLEDSEQYCEAPHENGDYPECSPTIYICLNEVSMTSGDCTTNVFILGPYNHQYNIIFPEQRLENGLPNPLPFELGKWKPNIGINVNVYQANTSKKIVYTDKPMNQYLTTPYVLVREENKARVVSYLLTSNLYMLFNLGYKAWCSTDYYGTDCSLFCSADNSPSGHYECNEKGEKICLKGWLNPERNCTESNDACLIDEPCQNGGICISKGFLLYECKCVNGYEGQNCTVSPPTTGRAVFTTTVEGFLTTEVTTEIPSTSTFESTERFTVTEKIESSTTEYIDRQTSSTSGVFTTRFYSEKPLMIFGHLGKQSTNILRNKLLNILADQMKVDKTVLILKMSLEYGYSIDKSPITALHLSVRIHNSDLSNSQIKSYLLANGPEWLEYQISHSIYQGDLFPEKSEESETSNFSLTIVLIVSFVIISLVAVLLITFLINVYMKRKRIQHARRISSYYGVQLRKDSQGFNVKIANENSIGINFQTEYEDPSKYEVGDHSQ